MKTIPIHLGDRSYDILLGAGAMERIAETLPTKRAIIVADESLVGIYARPLQETLKAASVDAPIIEVPSGEGSKSFASFELLLNRMFEHQPDRKTTLIALGGGVIGDLTGFAASVLLRGLPFIQIPTTLLAQIDSSVGGKTGINSAYGKNTIGAFYQPQAVLIDTNTLETLPEREMKAGYAEMMKYGLLGDAEFFRWLETNGDKVLARDSKALTYAIAHCCAMKAQIVAEDEREAGKRTLLNLGHTFGHALEAEAGYDGSLLHGEAVAIGMVLAARFAVTQGALPQADADRIQQHLASLGLTHSPKALDTSWPIDALMGHMRHDKKAQDGKITLISMHAIGEATIINDADEAAVRNVWQEALS